LAVIKSLSATSLGRKRLLVFLFAVALLFCSLPCFSGVVVVFDAQPSFTLDICGGASAFDRSPSPNLLAPPVKSEVVTPLIQLGFVWNSAGPQRLRAPDAPDTPPPRPSI